jgi:ABC-type phosphate/phosphonate transport system substrate-binding protein
MAGPPLSLAIGVRPDGGINTVSDLKGKTVAVSTLGSLTYWLSRQIAVQEGWGPDGIRTAELGTEAAQVSALKTKQVDGITSARCDLRARGQGEASRPFRRSRARFHDARDANKITEESDAVKRFLAWFGPSYMLAHKPTLKVYMQVSVPEFAASKNYDGARTCS